MDQRIGVNEFEGARRGHGEGAIAANGIGAGQAQHRPEALAASGEAVPHRVADNRRTVRGRRQHRGERRLDFSATRLEVVGEIH
jgi:hypothetical protein